MNRDKFIQSLKDHSLTAAHLFDINEKTKNHAFGSSISFQKIVENVMLECFIDNVQDDWVDEIRYQLKHLKEVGVWDWSE